MKVRYTLRAQADLDAIYIYLDQTDAFRGTGRQRIDRTTDSKLG